MAVRFVRCPSLLPSTPSTTADEVPPLEEVRDDTEDPIHTPTRPVSFLTEALKESPVVSLPTAFAASQSSSLFNEENALVASFESGYLHCWELRAARLLGKAKVHSEPGNTNPHSYLLPAVV